MFASFKHPQKRMTSSLRSGNTAVKRRFYKPINKYIVIGTLVIILIIVLFSLFIKFISLERFKVKAFEFIGEKSVSSEELQNDLSNFNTQNIFFIRNEAIKKQLLEKYPIFKSVKIIKLFPNKIVVNINEREPRLVLVNLNGAYVVDEDSKVIEIVYAEKVAFSEDDIVVIKDLGDPNAKYISDIFYADWKTKNPTLEDSLFKFDEIPLDKRLEALAVLNTNLVKKAKERFDVFQSKVSETKYASLDRIVAYDNIEYHKSDFVNENMLKLASEVLSFFNIQNKEIIKTISWKGNYMLVIELANGKTIIFSTHRNIAEQLDDYIYVKTQLAISGKYYKEINLSSSKISVK